MIKKPTEQVLVVREEWANQFSRQGLSTNIHPDFLTQLPKQTLFMNRPEAEHNPAFKQIIPYVLVCLNGKYLTVTRQATQGEERLHNKMSIGIGGHINPIDGRVDDLLDAGLRRELSEELMTNNPPGIADLKLVGLLRDDVNEVGLVHLGVVMQWNISEPISIRETDKMVGEYLTLDEISLHKDGLENWSRIVFDYLIAVPTT